MLIYKAKQKSILLIVVMMIFLFCIPVLAGEGDSSGGGQGNPLALVSSTPANGQKDVSLTPEITLTFSKNVVNMSVRDNNEKCFELYDDNKNKVSAKVILADDQIEPEKKRIIVISPTEKLKPGTSYTVKILPELQSKSGVTLGQPQEIRFTTAGVKVPEVTQKTSTVSNNTPSPKAPAAIPSPAPKSPDKVSSKQNELPAKEQPISQTNSENKSTSKADTTSTVNDTTKQEIQDQGVSSAGPSEDQNGENKPAATSAAEEQKAEDQKPDGNNPGNYVFFLLLAAAAALAGFVYMRRKKY